MQPLARRNLTNSQRCANPTRVRAVKKWVDLAAPCPLGGSLRIGAKHSTATDATREWAYDRESHDKGLDEAQERGWTVVDKKKDWEVTYPFQR